MVLSGSLVLSLLNHQENKGVIWLQVMDQCAAGRVMRNEGGKPNNVFWEKQCLELKPVKKHEGLWDTGPSEETKKPFWCSISGPEYDLISR